MWWLRNIAVMGLMLASACGFEPVYATRTPGEGAAVQMAAIAVQAPPGRLGQLLKAEVEDQLNPTAQVTGIDYNLKLDLSSVSQPFVIEQDGTASRYTVTFTAPFSLTRLADGAVITRGRVKRSVSYNVSETDDYATYTSQTDAMSRAVIELADDIKMRISAHLMPRS